MGVQEGRSNYESGIDSEAWAEGVSNSGSDWGDGVSSAGSDWSQGADGDSWAEGIEADEEINDPVPEGLKSDFESGVSASTQEFEAAGNDSTNQSNYEDGADDEAKSDYQANADGDAWYDGYTDVSNWGQ